MVGVGAENEICLCPSQPVRMHNWEVVIHFQVHGAGKHLFGDGFAMWYTKERGESGEGCQLLSSINYLLQSACTLCTN